MRRNNGDISVAEEGVSTPSFRETSGSNGVNGVEGVPGEVAGGENDAATVAIEPNSTSGAEETAEVRSESAFALWHAIRDTGSTGPEYQQFASPRLSNEERQEIWQLCLRRFFPRAGSLPAEPVLLYCRLGGGKGNWAVTRVTPAPSVNGRSPVFFDTLVFTAEEFDKVEANPFALLIGGAFDMVERSGISNGQALLPLSARELREIPMATDSATPLPNLGRGHHVEYRDRSLSILRQWFSWLGKVERKQYTFASWWSGAALEPTAPRDLFVITFTDKRAAVSPENLVERLRATSLELTRAVASLPVEVNIRYPVLGCTIGEMNQACTFLQMGNGLPVGWQGDDAWSFKRKALLALKNAHAGAEVFSKARGEANELSLVLDDLGVLIQALTEDLRNAPPASVSMPPSAPPTVPPAYAAVERSEPAAPQPPTTTERRFALGGPTIVEEAKPESSTQERKRGLGQNHPQGTDTPPRTKSPVMQWVALGGLGLAGAGAALYFIAPGLIGLAPPPSVTMKPRPKVATIQPADAVPEGKEKPAKPNEGTAVTPAAATNGPRFTIKLNTDGAIWGGVITASNPQDVASLKKLVPGARLLTYDDMQAKVYLAIGSKPVLQDNTAKFGAVYRYHPDTHPPTDGTEVKVVSLSGDPVTTTVIRRPANKASDRLVIQSAIYLAKGLKREDISDFAPDILNQAQQTVQQATAGASKTVAQKK